MASHPVVGIYNSVARARLAQEALIEEGVPEARVAISMALAHDGLSAEAPGQPYGHQPTGRGGEGWFGSPRRSDAQEARAPGYAKAAQVGACVVTAEARDAAEADRIQEVMAALRAIQIKGVFT